VLDNAADLLEGRGGRGQPTEGGVCVLGEGSSACAGHASWCVDATGSVHCTRVGTHRGTAPTHTHTHAQTHAGGLTRPMKSASALGTRFRPMFLLNWPSFLTRRLTPSTACLKEGREGGRRECVRALAGGAVVWAPCGCKAVGGAGCEVVDFDTHTHIYVHTVTHLHTRTLSR
jgi:hypothetical protein